MANKLPGNGTAGTLPLFTMEEQHVHAPKNHFSEAFTMLTTLYKERQLCDVILKVENVRFYTHKVILVACCQYFAAMFRSGMAEAHTSEVELHDVDPVALENILTLFYTGKVVVNGQNVQSLLSAASLFQIDHLREACSNFLRHQLSPSNCLGIKAFAELHGCQSLAEAAQRHTLARFSEVSQENEFLMLSFDQIESLTSDNKLKVMSEEEVFEAIMRWISHKEYERQQYLTKLLHNVRLALLSPCAIADQVLKNDLIKHNTDCRNLIDDVLVCAHLLPDRKGLLPSYQSQNRVGVSEGGLIYVIGGLGCTDNLAHSVERFDIHDSTWQVSQPMDILRSRVGVAVVEGKLYCFGGYDGTIHRLSAVECFDPHTSVWTQCTPMMTSRSAMGVAVLGELVYVIGGYDGIHSLSSVEIYNTRDDKWTMAPPLLTNRSAPGASVLNGCVYTVGGHDGLSIFNSVERYDPELQQWTFVCHMNFQRCRLGVTSAAGKIFSIGGYDGHQFLDTVECYDPQFNTWTVLPKMTCRRSRVGAVAVGNQIYAIGGYDGVSNLNSMEVYDLQREEWLPAPSMRKHYGAVGVAVIS